MPHATLTERWNAGEPALGAWMTSDTPHAVDAFAAAGYDYVCCDTQHSFLTEHDAGRLLRQLASTGTAAFVRVVANLPWLINRVVDMGADGVIVPMVNSAAEAAAAVSAVRFSPRGTRSLGPMRADLGVDTDRLEDRVSIFAMVETAEAVEHVDEICSVDGLAGVYVGPADLAITLGESPFGAYLDPPSEVVMDAIRTVQRAIERAGLIAGIHGTSPDANVRFAEMGFRLITLTTDGQAAAAGAAQYLEQTRRLSASV